MGAPTKEMMQSFESAFMTGTGSCRMRCECGKEFYDGVHGLGWEEGELEALKKSNAVEMDHGPSSIDFEGRFYVADCDCWHERATRIISFLDGHASKIISFYLAERKRLARKAETFARGVDLLTPGIVLMSAKRAD